MSDERTRATTPTMEDLLTDVLHELGYVWVEHINQHKSYVCFDEHDDHTRKIRMNRADAERVVAHLRVDIGRGSDDA
jgi:hypothetical protein